jgi:hypothetical protein
VVLPPEEGVSGILSKKSRSNIHFFKIFWFDSDSWNLVFGVVPDPE